MPRAGLNAERVVDAAEAMTSQMDLSDLTLAALAAKLGVRQPSLYKHIDSLEALRMSVAIRAKADLADQLGRAATGRARDEAMMAMAHAYRRWAHEHPGVYQLAQRTPRPDEVEHSAVTARGLEVMSAVISGYGLEGDDLVDAIRAFRSVVHGFVSLELGGGLSFSRDLDTSYDRLVTTLSAALATWNVDAGLKPTARARPARRGSRPAR